MVSRKRFHHYLKMQLQDLFVHFKYFDLEMYFGHFKFGLELLEDQGENLKS